MEIELAVRQGKEIVAGIDLGTTNSLVALRDGEGLRVLRDRKGRSIVPSVVAVDEHHHVIVGDEAKERAILNPEGTVTSVKRLMGRGVADLPKELRLPYPVVEAGIGRQAAVKLHGKVLLPQEVSAIILGECKRRAEEATGGRLKRAVITVPAYFDDAQRQATRDAARIAGIDVLRILNEPTAAALAYGLDEKKRGTVLVYDLGGGTFDVSLLKLTDGVFKVVATAGNTQLGGDDLDQRMVALLVPEQPREPWSPRTRRALAIVAEAAKIALSEAEQTQVRVHLPDAGIDVDRVVTRGEFEEAIRPLIDQTLRNVRFVLDEASLDPEDIDEVVCVGGSTRVPMVRRALEGEFGRPPHTELNPDEVVALGAAVQARVLAGDAGEDAQVLLDVTPLSLGIETYGGGVQKLMWRNTPIPARASEGFTTYVDDQTAVDLHILQGEREMAKDLRSLGRFKLRGIPKMAAGMPRVLVEFFVDANGILKVTAKETTSGQEASIEVKPTYGLTDEQVEDMIMDSIEHAEEDVEAHMLADLRADAGSVVRYARKACEELGDRLPSVMREQVESAISGLSAVTETNDREAIQLALSVLNETTQPIASMMMDEVLRVTVTGKTVREVLGDKERAAAHTATLG
jgi:Fe-S protein assembly chaperone HscA